MSGMFFAYIWLLDSCFYKIFYITHPNTWHRKLVILEKVSFYYPENVATDLNKSINPNNKREITNREVQVLYLLVLENIQKKSDKLQQVKPILSILPELVDHLDMRLVNLH